MKKPKPTYRGPAAERRAMPEEPGSYVRGEDGELERTDTPQELSAINPAAPAPVLPEASRLAIAAAMEGAGFDVPDHLGGPAEPVAIEGGGQTELGSVGPSEQTQLPPVKTGGQTEEG
ncbi:hypothetical protein BH10PSE5_BH10PSE5_01230 [soil metagenome]